MTQGERWQVQATYLVINVHKVRLLRFLEALAELHRVLVLPPKESANVATDWAPTRPPAFRRRPLRQALRSSRFVVAAAKLLGGLCRAAVWMGRILVEIAALPLTETTLTIDLLTGAYLLLVFLYALLWCF